MTDTTTTTELSPLIKQGQVALREGASLAAVAAAMLAEMPEVESLLPAVPTAPAPVILTPEVKESLEQMAEVFAAVQPTERRLLTDTEVAALYIERDVVKQVGEVLAGREENIKEYVRNHLDIVAEETGRVDANTPRDGKGHYVVTSPSDKYEVLPVAGTNQVFRREFKNGKASVALDVVRVVVKALIVKRLSLFDQFCVTPLLAESLGCCRKVVVSIRVLRITSDRLLELLKCRRVLTLFVKPCSRSILAASSPLAPPRRCYQAC